MRYDGLTKAQVDERVRKHQVNRTSDDISKTKKEIIREHTLTYFNFVNVVLGLFVLSTGQIKNMTFLMVVIVNTVIGIVQELKVKETIDKLSIVTAKHAVAFRDGKKQTIPTNEIVMDDVLYVAVGDQISTDCKVIESHGLELNEALLTGETKPVRKNEGDELLAGTFVSAGTGVAKVIRVGNDNYSSTIVTQAKDKNLASSIMRDTIERIIFILSIIIIPVGFLLFKAQYAANPTWSAAIVKTVGGVVGMIPEGLVLLTSLSFVIGVGRLARKKALVQQMEAIEALARVDELCLDKTGTITTGQLEVKYLIPLGSYTPDMLKKLMGTYVYASDDENATQKALKAYFTQNDDYQKIDEIPFSSDRKYRVITFKELGSFALGAPDYLARDDQELMSHVEEYAQEGMRVLLLAKCDINADHETISNIQKAAMIVISDIIKEDAMETFKFFEDAKVSIRVLSGDNPVTVARVCTLAGVQDADHYIDASTLPQDIDEMAKVIGDCHVFGRVKPEQKQLIVKALQKQKHIVGMVGDGVNDVLAIKDADCGIAMANGADAAKQAAHIVLIDSNFSSMKEIVEEGRTIIANIEKVSSLYLTKTIYSTLLSLIFGAIGLVYPFTPFQLSLISAFAIGIPSFFITLQKNPNVVSEGFLKHVMHIAFPCALAVVTHVMFMLLLKSFFKLDNIDYVTFCFLVTNFIAYIVVYKVSKPFTIINVIVLICTFTLSNTIIYKFPNLVDILPYAKIHLFWFVCMIILSILYVHVYTTVVDNWPFKMHNIRMKIRGVLKR